MEGLNSIIDADANAGVPVCDAAWEAFEEALCDYGNPSSGHALGRRAAAKLEEARRRVAEVLGVSPSEIVFTSGGTESNALALWGVAGHGDAAYVSTTIEHPSVSQNLALLEKRRGARIERVAASKEGVVDAAEMVNALDTGTRCVSMIAVSNETGVWQPCEELSEALRGRDVALHLDAVQAVWEGRMARIARWGDLVSFSGHKMGAVDGIGVLVCKDGQKLRPLLEGGGQERGLRASTENVAGAASLAVALETLESRVCPKRLAGLRDRFEKKLGEVVTGAVIIGQRAERLPNTSCVHFPCCDGDALMMALDLRSVAVSTGSACSTGSIEPSAVLMGMGLDPTMAKQTLRFSFGPWSDEAQIDTIVERTRDVVERVCGAHLI